MRSDAFASLRRKRRPILQASAILIAVVAFAVTTEGSDTRFHMLPALQTDAATSSLMLDAATDGQRILIAGEQGHILYSDNSGTSWTHAQVPVSLAITAVTFSGSVNAFATAHDGTLLRSTDRGQSWQTNLTGVDVARMSADVAEAMVKQLQAELDLAAPGSNEDLEWALEDAQFAFEDASENIDFGVTIPLLDVWLEDDRSGYALGAYGILLHTTDGGTTWTLLSNRLDNPEKYHLYGIALSKSGTLLVAGEAGTLLRSRDGGENWDRPDSPYQGSFFGIVAADDGAMLTFGLKGNVFRSTDDGDTWSAIVTGDQRTLLSGMTRADGTIVLVGSAGAVLKSNDDGASFTVTPTTGNRMYSGVTETVDGKLLLVGFGGVSFADGVNVDGVNSHE